MQPLELFPAAGYRPHFSLPGSHYLMGIVFLVFFGDCLLDSPVIAEVETLYDGVDYSALMAGQLVEVREGPGIVGHGVIMDKLDETA